MDDDLKSIAAARRCAEDAFKAYQQFLGTDPAHVDAIVECTRRVRPRSRSAESRSDDDRACNRAPIFPITVSRPTKLP